MEEATSTEKKTEEESLQTYLETDFDEWQDEDSNWNDRVKYLWETKSYSDVSFLVGLKDSHEVSSRI